LVSVSTDLKADVINTSAATFNDDWALHQQLTNIQNPYANGSAGVWRNDGSFAYQIARNQSNPVTLKSDGTFILEQFNWEQASVEAIPHWIKGNNLTKYSAYSYELENQDVLGIYSAALYDYGGHLPSANGVNMRNDEMAFTSFEYLDHQSSGNWVFGDQPTQAYTSYEVVAAQNYIAIVKASLDDVSQASVVDVASRALIAPFPHANANFIQDDPIVCLQPYPGNSNWSMIVLRRSPYSGLWRGTIRLKNVVSPVAVPVIDNSFAHAGKTSLKITSQQTYKQELLHLDSGKTYFLSGWVSVKNFNLKVPKLADNIGIDIILKDKHGNLLSTTSFQPAGRIIEGWQQIKGSFICPDKNSHLQITFKPGSTGTSWYDDIRIHPNLGNMKSYVYDLKDYKVRAILDEENFASFFYYDQEGNLTVTKKETEEGIKTLSENISYTVEK